MYADPAFLEGPGWRGDPRRRLRVCLVLGAVVIGAFLSMLNLPNEVSFTSPARLIAVILRNEPAPAEQTSPPETVIPEENQALIDIQPRVEEPKHDETPAGPGENPPASRLDKDWNAAIAEIVAVMGDERSNRENARSAMWRQTHSIMFQPDDAIVLNEQQPVLQDFRFKPQLHVAGIGMTIGSCFFGLPLVGVPVEERTVAVRLFVCAKD